MAEHETCYIYSPDESDGIEQRPSKRRRADAVHQRESGSQNPFIPLLRGKERPEDLKIRAEAYEKFWKPQELIIKNIVNNTNVAALEKVVSFVNSQDSVVRETDKIPVALLVATPGNGVPPDFMECVARQVEDQKRTVLVKLTVGQTTNLKIVLKMINMLATSQGNQLGNENSVEEPREGRRLSYDLEILQNYVHRFTVRRVMVYFQDSEALDSDLLSDLVDVLSSWQNRIPFILFFGISTSVELFQEKLTKRALTHLDGQSFGIECVDVESLFAATHQCQNSNLPSTDREECQQASIVRIGPVLAGSMMSRQQENIQSWSTFNQMFKYAYMSHFFANPLAAAVIRSFHGASLGGNEEYQAMRNLPSFRRYCEILLDRHNFSEVNRLLDNDEYLGKVFEDQVKVCNASLDAITSAVTLFHVIQSTLSKESLPWSKVYIMAMSGQLADSDLLEDTLLSMKKATSSVASDLLETIIQQPDLTVQFVRHHAALDSMLTKLPNDGPGLRSGHDVQHHNLRTTIVAQKVELSQHAATLTKEEAQYTKILEELNDALKRHLHDNLVDPRGLFPIEALVYDLPSPHRDVFTPRPRFAIERALTRPHDYLGHECCEDRSDAVSSLQPATSILYDLYLECGSQINTADLWSAFWTVVNPQGEDEDADKEEVLTLFERALGELKYLGLIRNSRKKADHLAKLSWNGL